MLDRLHYKNEKKEKKQKKKKKSFFFVFYGTKFKTWHMKYAGYEWIKN